MWKEVIDASYIGGYSFSVLFNNGERKEVNLLPLIDKYPVFAPLRDTSLIKDFTLTDTLEWLDGRIDIAPEYLYDNGV